MGNRIGLREGTLWHLELRLAAVLKTWGEKNGSIESLLHGRALRVDRNQPRCEDEDSEADFVRQTDVSVGRPETIQLI